jgi:outer membrane protein TolC
MQAEQRSEPRNESRGKDPQTRFFAGRRPLDVLFGAISLLLLARSAHADRLGIDDVVRLTLASSPELSAERARARARDERGTSAFRRMLPSVRLTEEYQHWDSPFEIEANAPGAPPGTAVRVREQDTNNLTLLATQPLLGLLRRSQEHKARSREAEAALLGVRASESELSEAVALEYLRMFEAKARAEIARSSEQDLAGELRDTEARVEAGKQTKADLLRVRVAVASAHQQGILADADVTVARANILSALGRSPDDTTTEFEPPTQLLARANPTVPAPADVLSRRPELEQAKLRAESAEHLERSRFYALFPEVNLAAAYSRIDGQIFMPKNSAFIGVQANWTLWEWGANVAEKRAAAAEARASASETDATQRRILVEVALRKAELGAAASAVTVAEATIASAEEAYRVTGELVRAAEGTTTDLLSAEAALVNARLMLERARYAQAMARVRLTRAIGYR